MQSIDTPQALLKIDDETPVVTVTLNQGDRRNPLSLAVMRELTAVLAAQGKRARTRSIVLRANGPAFSSGHDLRELIGRSLDEEHEIFVACTELMQTIQRLPQPVIAAVQGAAAAAGCQLVASCDLAIAAANARFSTPGVRIGLFCSTPMVALSRNIGRKRALEMLLTGEPIDAATAADWGLINKVVPEDELFDQVLALAEKIGRASALTVRIGKRAFYEQAELDQDQAYQMMGKTMAANAVKGDAQEGMTAFLDKRAPVWRGE
jgi:enoyl-CoA hydratase/carnithine racemase